MRRRLEEINEALSAADLKLCAPTVKHDGMLLRVGNDHVLYPAMRTLYRIFNRGSFSNGGRFFGGTRPYFVCPGIVNGIACGRGVAKLYGAGAYFLCRHCYRLAYATQREDRYDRALRRANNIRMRLGGEPGTASLFPNRPKGMHNANYKRLQSAVLNAEILAEERLVIFLEQLQRRERRSKRRVSGRPSKEFWR